jgi:hypothetical protein
MRIWQLCFLAPTLFLAGCGDEDKAPDDRSTAAPVILGFYTDKDHQPDHSCVGQTLVGDGSVVSFKCGASSKL